MERLILGGSFQAACNCLFAVLCTMPVTFWVRVGKYLHHCPQHQRSRGGRRTLTSNRNEPFWFGAQGELLSSEEFTETFQKLTAEGVLTLVPGYITNQGRTKLPSVLSMEGTHWIIESGKTEMLRRE